MMIKIIFFLEISEVHSEPSHASKMVFFEKITKNFYPLTIFTKNVIVDVLLGFENASEKLLMNNTTSDLLKKFEDTHWENTPSNKTKALQKFMNMRIWEIDMLNQLFNYLYEALILKLNFQNN